MNDTIEYILYPSNRKPIKFKVSLDFFSNTYDFPNPDEAPEWTRLENHQCSHCPLSIDKVKLCPLAERLVRFEEKLSDLNSIEVIKVTINQAERSKHMEAPVQDVLGSLLGLFFATSDCPYTRFLRPMAHFHLPLADESETVYRVLSMYRLAQFFKKQTVGKAYAGFDELNVHYANLVEVNRCLSRRLKDALRGKDRSQDGTINAINLLDALSQYVPASIDDAIEDLEPIFNAYWKDISATVAE